ncbi:xylose isomerase domain-containing protein [Caballeronia temeraria]|uniref:Xylose isomerase domain-containing protein n=1 Tax=Caballeronia temeraria TaxID=1777137 RepID=A0A158DL98_9BURK|nr:TIM barrel protein [Caballeronia temeraria]SAK95382.1 xylose isomerase domain-containing protein [Caballeronia temeraria]
MPKLSLHHLTMLDAHPLQLVDAAYAGGFDYYGLRMVAPTAADTIVDVAHNPALIRELRARMDATGVRLLDIEAIWLQSETCIESLLPAMEAGHRLGARHVLTVGYDEDRARLLDNFCALCEAAAQFDMTVGLEMITYCAIGTLDDALATVRASAQPNARLLLDALQFFRSGAKVSDLDRVAPTLIEYVQICDAPLAAPISVEERRVEARTARLLPNDGELPLRSFLAALPRNLTLAVEAPTLALRGLPFDEQAGIIMTKMKHFLV